MVLSRLGFLSKQDFPEKLEYSLDHFRQLEDTRSYGTKLHKQTKRPNFFSVAALVIASIALFAIFYPTYESDSIRSQYHIEYLSGGEKATWKSWRIVDGAPMSVSIINPAGLNDERVSVVIDAIQSKEILHKADNNNVYVGWLGALEEAANFETKYNIPTEFNIINAVREEGDIVIILSDLKNDDGYTGYTRSLVADNEILKSYITIYNVHNLSDKQLSTIVKHEFGHAIGLSHSSNPNNLMHDTIKTANSYISSCNIDALVSTYNGKQADISC